MVSTRHLRPGYGKKCPNVFRLVAAKGPVVPEAAARFYDDSVVGDFFLRFLVANRELHLITRPRSTCIDPFFEKSDLLFVETVILFGGHLVVGIFPTNRLHQSRLFRIPKD